MEEGWDGKGGGREEENSKKISREGMDQTLITLEETRRATQTVGASGGKKDSRKTKKRYLGTMRWSPRPEAVTRAEGEDSPTV